MYYYIIESPNNEQFIGLIKSRKRLNENLKIQQEFYKLRIYEFLEAEVVPVQKIVQNQ